MTGESPDPTSPYPSEILIQLRGARLMCVGFSYAEFLRIAGVLASAKAITTEGSWEHCGPEHCDAAIVKLAQAQGTAGLCAPLLAIGSPADIAGAVVRLPPHSVDYLAAPWSPLELLARLFRLLTPTAGEGGRYAVERPRMVIADDDPSLTRLLKATLSDHMDCVVVDNGLRALRAVRESPPNALILDVNMPVMNGFEALRAIRDDPGLKYLPVILLTASEELADVSRAKGLAADDYVVKPFGVNDLLQRLHRVLNSADRRRPAPPRPSVPRRS